MSAKRILIIRLGAMGDIIHALPAVAQLRMQLPRAKFGWIIEKRWSDLLNAELNNGHSLLDKIHRVDTRKWRKNLFSRLTWSEASSVFREIRREQYDIAVDLQGAMKSALVALLSGAPRRYGFAEAWEKPASLFYTYQVHTLTTHVVEKNLELATAMGAHETPNSRASFRPEINYRLEPENGALQQLVAAPFAVLNPGAGWGAKQWPADRYAEVARALGAQGIRSLINFGPGEEILARRIEQRSDGYGAPVQLSIAELIAVTSRARLFVGGDTGPMHLAALLQIPVIAIFGPTDPARTGPYSEKCIVLRDIKSRTSHKRSKETESGLLNITVAQVIAAAHALLGGGLLE
jgi:heptosyltransferase-1